MPIREYQCPQCAFKVERLELTPDHNPIYCERCQCEHDHAIEMERITSAPAIQFRGQGWTRKTYSIKPVRAGE